MRPTQEAYEELQQAYDWFNKTLFGGTLPPCLITLQRNKRTFGFFYGSRFVNRQSLKTDEIAINPAFFAVRSAEDVLSTLVHEMVHLWQYHFGKPGRRGYHNKAWGMKMKEIGLHPSHTGQPDGKETGEQMTHFILADGAYIKACRGLLATRFALSWYDRFPAQVGHIAPSGGGVEISLAPVDAVRGLDVITDPVEPDRSNRHKYQCPECGINAWAKPNLHLVCGACRVDLGVLRTD